MREVIYCGSRYRVEHEPIELRNGDLVGYACGKCHTFTHKDCAEVHCAAKLCDKCDRQVIKPYLYCQEHAAESRAMAERLRFEKAVKVKYEEYEGVYLYIEDCGYNNGYFGDVDELLDWIKDSLSDDPDFNLPTYAWACDEKKFRLDASDMIGREIEDHHEEASVPSAKVDELQRLLDTWCDSVGITSYVDNRHTAVLLDGLFDDLLDEIAEESE